MSSVERAYVNDDITLASGERIVCVDTLVLGTRMSYSFTVDDEGNVDPRIMTKYRGDGDPFLTLRPYESGWIDPSDEVKEAAKAVASIKL